MIDDDSVVCNKPFSWWEYLLVIVAVIVISISVFSLDWSVGVTQEVVRNASLVPLPPFPDGVVVIP